MYIKKALIVLALGSFTAGFAQVDTDTNASKKKTTTTTKTIVKDSDGRAVQTKKATTTQEQEIALNNFDGRHNFNTTMRPSEVDTDIYYSNNGTRYSFRNDTNNDGFIFVDEANPSTEYARIRPTSQDGYYIYSQDGNNSFGYFNEDGDFIIESYDPDNDGVSNYIYKIDADDMDKSNMKRNKMKK